MAIKSVFSPELKGKLQEKQRYLAAGQKAISQFSRFPGPDDEYYFRLAKVTAGADRKTQGFKFNFKFVCVANKRTRDPEFAGSPMNITFRCFTTKNSTEEENWNRFYTDGMQALGFPTQKWPADQAMTLLDEALGTLNETKPPVVLRIRTDGQYQNANIVEVLKGDALDEFAQPSLEVSDDMPDDHDDIDDSLSPADQQLAQLKATMSTMDRAKLTEAITGQKINCPNASTLTDDALRDVIYTHFEVQLKGTPTPTEQSKLDAPAEEVVEEVEEVLESTDFKAALMVAIATFDRKRTQLALKKRIADRKFFPSETDGMLHEALFAVIASLGDDGIRAFLTEQNVPF